MKKFLCLCLAALMLMSVLVGCKKEEEPTPPDSSNPPDSGDTSQTLNDADTLKEYNFNGAEYKMLVRGSTNYEFNPENTSGMTTVNNALFNRNESVKSRFNVNIRIEEKKGDWTNNAVDCEWYQRYQTTTQSGWSDVHLAAAHSAQVQRAVNAGFCRDLTTLETVDMKKEWWSKQFYDNCNIDGKFYMAVGDIAYTLYQYMEVVFFNEELAESMIKDASGNPVDLYALVKEGNGEWTWEKMKQYTLLLSTANGLEQYGLLSNSHSERSYTTAFELQIATKSGEGNSVRYIFPLTPNERATTAIDDIVTFFRDNNGTSLYTRNNNGIDKDHMNPIFAAGNALFYTQTLDQVVYISENLKNAQYGILPFPKYDEDQMEYHTALRDSLTAVSVPHNVQDLDLAGVVTEALCMYSYQIVRPEYLNNVMGGRYMTNANLREILDLCRENVTVDFVMVYSSVLGTPYSSITEMIRSGQKFTSYYEGKCNTWNTNLASVYKALGVSNS